MCYKIRSFTLCLTLQNIHKESVHALGGAACLALDHVAVHAEGVHVNAVPDEVFYPSLFRSLFCLTSIETRPADAFLLGKSLARSGFF